MRDKTKTVRDTKSKQISSFTCETFTISVSVIYYHNQTSDKLELSEEWNHRTRIRRLPRAQIPSALSIVATNKQFASLIIFWLTLTHLLIGGYTNIN